MTKNYLSIVCVIIEKKRFVLQSFFSYFLQFLIIFVLLSRLCGNFFDLCYKNDFLYYNLLPKLYWFVKIFKKYLILFMSLNDINLIFWRKKEIYLISVIILQNSQKFSKSSQLTWNSLSVTFREKELYS